jgi:hypothetical protein
MISPHSIQVTPNRTVHPILRKLYEVAGRPGRAVPVGFVTAVIHVVFDVDEDRVVSLACNGLG